MRFGTHACMWIGEWTAEAGHTAIEMTARHGFDFIEIPVLDPSSFDASPHARHLGELGLGVVCSTVLPREAHMADHPELALAFLIRVLDTAHALGASMVTGCLAYAPGVRGALTHEYRSASEANMVDALKAAAFEGQRRSIVLALEQSNRTSSSYCNTLRDTSRLVDRVDHDHLRLHADTYHMNLEEEDYYRPLRNHGHQLAYVHLSENHRGKPGTGTVRWEQVWTALADSGYAGPLALESFSEPLRSGSPWRAPNGTPQELAVQGLAWMRSSVVTYGLQ